MNNILIIERKKMIK